MIGSSMNQWSLYAPVALLRTSGAPSAQQWCLTEALLLWLSGLRLGCTQSAPSAAPPWSTPNSHLTRRLAAQLAAQLPAQKSLASPCLALSGLVLQQDPAVLCCPCDASEWKRVHLRIKPQASLPALSRVRPSTPRPSPAYASPGPGPVLCVPLDSQAPPCVPDHRPVVRPSAGLSPSAGPVLGPRRHRSSRRGTFF